MKNSPTEKNLGLSPARATGCMLSRIGQYRTGSGGAYTVPVIYWHLTEETPDMDTAANVEAFRAAFEIWQLPLAPIQLESTSEKSKANILIHFANNGDKDLPIPFDANTLAYAYFPVGNRSDIWVNDRLNWASMHSPTHYNLKKVIAHEIGHSLNLGHSTVRGDIMEAIYAPNDKITVTADTLNGINKVYAALKKKIKVPPPTPGPTVPPPTPGPTVPPPAGSQALLAALFPDMVAIARLTPIQLAALVAFLKVEGGTRQEVIERTYRTIFPG